MTNNSTIAGNGNSLALVGNAQINAGISGTPNLTFANGNVAQSPAGGIQANVIILNGTNNVILNQVNVGGTPIVTATSVIQIAPTIGELVILTTGTNLALSTPITATGGITIASDSGISITGNVVLTAGAPIVDPVAPTPGPTSVLVIANQNAVAGGNGNKNIVINGGTLALAPSNPGNAVFYVDSQSGSTLGSVQPLDFSPNTVFTGNNGNLLNLVNGNRGSVRLAIAGRLETNDQAGQLSIDDLIAKLKELTDPARGDLGFTVDDEKRRKLAALVAAFNKQRGAGGISPGRFGPFQFTGYDFQSLKDAGFGTPLFDATKVDEGSMKSILEGLPLAP